MNCVGTAVVASVVGTHFFNAQAADKPLTLAEAQRLAVARSRQLHAQDLSIIASREMAIAAGQLPDPVLKLGIDNLPVNGPDRGSLTSDFMTMRRIGIMQEFTRGDKRRLRAERYDRAADKSLAEKAVVIAAIQRDTAIAWLARLYAERMAAVIAEQALQARLEIEAAEGSYRAGRGSQADIFAARSVLAMVDDRNSDMQRKVRSAKTMLARWSGDVAELPLAEPPRMDGVRLDSTALDASLVHHPQIEALSRQAEMAEADVKLADANKKSDWTLELSYQQRGPAYSNMLSIGLSLPFQWDQKNRQERELSARLATAEQAKAERDDALRAHIAETRVMMEEWQNGLERIARYERELIPFAMERTQASLGAYRGGKSSLTDLLSARRNEIELRLQTLQLQADTARLWAQLNFLIPDDGAGRLATHSAHQDMP
ncbi:TolC family protein [Undibacterium sp. Jales W-56]|uniref:TolC family protein n=1 Tax=Undibacterium sp. Jales W-56 TaxID=2897325 RepID=UPI0021D31646|nr:TolC family protein [Undibacterium sp. Jales W-56]MCU6433992.1 TolC family protein [Undibacterium sp. Jales W-56]